MAQSYTKLWSGIVGSTIWAEDHPTRIVWITLLALADQHGEVMGTPVGLARIANVTLEECTAALAKFLAPEPSKHDDGRKIEEIEHGWHLLNHAKYRRLASKAEAIEKNAERQRRYRERQSVTVTKRNAQVTTSNGEVTQERYIAEAEAEAEAEKSPDNSVAKRAAERRGARLPEDWRPSEEDRAFAADLGLDPDQLTDEFRDYWCALPGARGRKLDWSKTWRNRCRELGSKRRQSANGRETYDEARIRKIREALK